MAPSEFYVSVTPLQFAPENYFFSGSRAGNGASSTAGQFVSNSPEQTVVHYESKNVCTYLFLHT